MASTRRSSCTPRPCRATPWGPHAGVAFGTCWPRGGGRRLQHLRPRVHRIGARIGDRVTVKNAVLVWDGVTVEDDVFLGPGMVFTNDLNPRAAIGKTSADFVPTTVRRGATIGANATVVCGHEVGEHAFVGAGAVVTSDVAPHAFVVGNPARPIGWACECGLRLPDDLRCPGCGRAYRLGPEGSPLPA